MQDDPGRQMMTGSFHPIDEGEWATQAYLGQVEKLFQAVANDDLETVVDIVEKGFDLKRRDHIGRTPLQLAIMARSEAVAKYLIDAGARITSRLVDGRTALHLAAQLGQAEIIDKLLERSKQNELRAEREKVEADAKAKAASKQKQDADMSKSPADEDEEMRPSSEDDWSSDEATSKRDKKAKSPKPTVNDPPAEGAAIPEDNDDLPDILDITAVDWDQVNYNHLSIK
jgi:ankyrin repeat protein